MVLGEVSHCPSSHLSVLARAGILHRDVLGACDPLHLYDCICVDNIHGQAHTQSGGGDSHGARPF